MKATFNDAWGNDRTVVNNARVSFDKESQWSYVCSQCGSVGLQKTDCDGPCTFKRGLSPEDQRLIQYLARGVTLGDYRDMILRLQATGETDEIISILDHWRRTPEHWAPFANGVGAQFHIKAPIPIMRQVFKHKVGSVENEVSRRYVSNDPEMFYPEWRWAPKGSIKQGSGDLHHPETQADINDEYDDLVARSRALYKRLVKTYSVAPEQARFALLQSTYTEARVSNSLYGWANFYNQRHDRIHAQSEIADLADEVGKVMSKEFPVSWAALTRTFNA